MSMQPDVYTYTDQQASIRDKIEALLTIYPRLSPSMLQTGIGPKISPGFWRPILYQMINEGMIVEGSVRYRTPKGHFRSAAVLYFSEDYLAALQAIEAESPTMTADEEPAEGPPINLNPRPELDPDSAL